ncbi:hypothetical protein SteCoe_12464 [Stentor coeruleus]|uniref:COMM domain-containing protein n=1 Tax=Stentor coeruleus TaxID=5963 RepID=A0A1R2CAS6_9CILI|nr:hypothetical protein SteCoe_12464 [Stentor coeruleus]
MDELLDTVDWLQDVSEAVLTSLFEYSLGFLQGKVDKKTLGQLADSLEKTPESTERVLEALGFMITSICTGRTIPDIPWAPALQSFVKENQGEIKLSYSLNSLHNPLQSTFKDFDWRFEVQTSSRAVEDVTVPKIILQITTDNGQEVLECDYANMKNLYTQLRQALKTFESVRAKKTEKFLKPSKNL